MLNTALHLHKVLVQHMDIVSHLNYAYENHNLVSHFELTRRRTCDLRLCATAWSEKAVFSGEHVTEKEQGGMFSWRGKERCIA